MAKAFPTDNPFLANPYFAPVNTEADAGHLQITGEMPKELTGTLYRNGPNPQFAPRGPHHWFGGDGMIHAFHIENGNVSYRNRWVRTPKWTLENEEGEALFGTFGNPMFTDPKVMNVNSTLANTNIVWHGGKLLALEEAHASKIIHRDLKPHNLYLTRGEAEPDFIKLLDFGIARLRVEGNGNEHLTQTGTMVGTPAYLAPEVWQGAVADERSDIYSLGVTLHYLVTGVTPFEELSLVQLQAAHVTAKPLQLRLAGHGLECERLEPLLLRCLARLPEERMQSAREVREALEELYDASAWTRADAERFWDMAAPAATRSAPTWTIRSPELRDATRLAPDPSAA